MSLKFLSVKRISYNIAWYVANYKKESHAQKYVYYYVLQAIIGETLKTIIILILMYLMGLIYEGILALTVFCSIRIFGSGFHADSTIKCLIYTLSIIMFICFSSIFVINYLPIYISAYIYILFIPTLYLFIKLAPKENHNKPIFSDEYRKNLKSRTIWIYLVWTILSILLKIYSYHLFATLIIISAFIQATTLTNCFENTCLKIEKTCTSLFCTSF